MNVLSHSISSGLSLPDSSGEEVAKLLADNEQVVAWMEGDLDTNLHFTQYLLVLSNSRILAKSHQEKSWHDWPYRKGLTLQRHDHAGIGTLELFDGEARLACWRYTLAQNTAAQRVVTHFEQHLAAIVTGQAVSRPAESVCPNCQAQLAPGQEECPYVQLKRISRLQPGCCSACGASPIRIRDSCCWALYSRWQPLPLPWCRLT